MARKLHELGRARARVQQLERELRGELPMPEVAVVPEFLTQLSRTAFRRFSERASATECAETPHEADVRGGTDPENPCRHA
jgi:hypothetical protein